MDEDEGTGVSSKTPPAAQEDPRLFFSHCCGYRQVTVAIW